MPLKEGNISEDLFPALSLGMRDFPLTAEALFFHQGLHVRLALLCKGSYLPVTCSLPRHPIPLKSSHNTHLLLYQDSRKPQSTFPSMFHKPVTGTKDFSPWGNDLPLTEGH